MKQPAIQIPEGVHEVLLHACCAPCSSAIVEWLVQHDIRPIIYYYNPNIWPREEYNIRKEESKRHAESLGIRWIDGDYDHERWRQGVCGLEGEPERGRRCEQCFTLRLTAAARKAQELGIPFFATTLASISTSSHPTSDFISGPRTGGRADCRSVATNCCVSTTSITSNTVAVSSRQGRGAMMLH